MKRLPLTLFIFGFFFLVKTNPVWAVVGCSITGPNTVSAGVLTDFVAHMNIDPGYATDAVVLYSRKDSTDSWIRVCENWFGRDRDNASCTARISFASVNATYELMCNAYDFDIPSGTYSEYCTGDPLNPKNWPSCGTGSHKQVNISGSSYPGIVYYGGNLTTNIDPSPRDFTDYKVSFVRWRAKDNPHAWELIRNYQYDSYWANLLYPKTLPNGNGPNVLTTGAINAHLGIPIKYYRIIGDLTVSGDQIIDRPGSAVYLIEGSLNVNAKIVRQVKDGFLGFIVKDNINIKDGLTNTANSLEPVIDGFFYAGEVFNSGTSPTKTEKLLARGIYIAAGGFNFSRDLGDATNANTAAEQFTFDPSLVLNAPTDFLQSRYTWREVAP